MSAFGDKAMGSERHFAWQYPQDRMSALGGGLKRSTQHFFSDARDGVERRWVEDMFEVSMRCGRGGVEEPLAVRIRSSTEWLGNSMNGRARLCASKPEPNEIQCLCCIDRLSRQSKADIDRCPGDVRFTPKSGHGSAPS